MTPWHARAGRPLTARSVMASALLGMDPPELPVAQLVRLTGLFGISENGARVALSRMVAAGEATSDGAGHYRLAGHLADRQARQSASRAAVDHRLRRFVVARRRDDERQHGRGPRRPPPCPLPTPGWPNCAKACGCGRPTSPYGFPTPWTWTSS